MSSGFAKGVDGGEVARRRRGPVVAVRRGRPWSRQVGDEGVAVGSGVSESRPEAHLQRETAKPSAGGDKFAGEAAVSWLGPWLATPYSPM